MLSDLADQTLKLANPREESTNYGCVRDQDYMSFYDDVVADAQSQGGIVTIGGFQN